MPLLISRTKPDQDTQEDDVFQSNPSLSPPILVKNRRKRYLDRHPEYFSADLELAGPLALSSPIDD